LRKRSFKREREIHNIKTVIKSPEKANTATNTDIKNTEKNYTAVTREAVKT